MDRSEDRPKGQLVAAWFSGALAVVLCLLAQTAAQTLTQRGVPEIWFVPRQDDVDANRPPADRIGFAKYDFPKMVADATGWDGATAHLGVVTVSLHTIERYPDLAAVVAMTKRYGFKVATSGSIVFTNGACLPHGMEGMDTSKDFAQEIVAAIRRWSQAGGRLDYVIMDSPFYFGYFASADSCHLSIEEVAHRAAITLAEIRKLYPDVKVMDADGPGPTRIDQFLPLLRQWLRSYAAATGRSLDAFAMDLHWVDTWHTGYEWQDAARRITAVLHEEKVRAGLIINTEDRGVDEAQWFAAVRSHLHDAARSGIPLDFIQFASWMKYPLHNLPDSSTTPWTSLVTEAVSEFGGGKR